MRYWVITYKRIVDGNSHDEKLLFKTRNVLGRAHVRKIFEDFWGKKMNEVRDLVFEGFDTGVSVRGWQELKQEEFRIMEKHLPTVFIPRRIHR
jgi:hypothetical protein